MWLRKEIEGFGSLQNYSENQFELFYENLSRNLSQRIKSADFTRIIVQMYTGSIPVASFN